MRFTKFRTLIILFIIAIIGTTTSYYYFTKSDTKKIYATGKPEKRTIKQIVSAMGALEAQGTLNIGSLIPGVIDKLFKEENDMVKKGELLATIDNGKGDTDVKENLGKLRQAEAEVTYVKNFYGRQKTLYEKEFISLDAFEQAAKKLAQAEDEVAARKAAYERAVINFENSKIISPINGIIIAKKVSERETVSVYSPPTILYTIASDIKVMDVKLNIDEGSIGLVKLNQAVDITFDTYPEKMFYGNIREISNAPIKAPGTINYEVTITLDNSKLLLKPGMTVNAVIHVDKRENVWAVPSHILSFKKKYLESLASVLGYDFKPLSKQEKEQAEKNKKNPNHNIKSIWIIENKAIKEVIIEIGINDNAFFEVVTGITGSETIITDIEEPDIMKEFLGRMFGKGTSK